MSSVFAKAILLDKYYELRSKSALDGGVNFQFGSFRMGHGFLNGDGTIADIPSTTTVLPSVFHTGVPVLAYANGRTAINCLMPAGTIGSSETKKFSLIGLYDKVGDELIAILAGGELDLTSVDKLEIASYIDNALSA